MGKFDTGEEEVADYYELEEVAGQHERAVEGQQQSLGLVASAVRNQDPEQQRRNVEANEGDVKHSRLHDQAANLCIRIFHEVVHGIILDPR